MNKPLVSIIIVTFNAGKHLKGCLDSIFEQKCEGLEILIKDGGSTDDTLSIIEAHKSRISYFESSADAGIYDAMNNAVKKAKGRWLYFLGADDRLLEGFSALCAKLKDEHAIYYGDCVTDNGFFGGKFSNYKLTKAFMCQQAILYPAVVFEKYHYDTRFKVFADLALNIKCWGDNAIKKRYYAITIAWYNLSGFSSDPKDDLFKQEKQLLIKNNMSRIVYLRFLYKRWKEQRKPGSDFF
jgi:glycosyltransferase involved in cell wall biosynthesis